MPGYLLLMDCFCCFRTFHFGSAIFKENELDKNSVYANFAYTASDGKTYEVAHYNLDVIISVGYRVKSLIGTQFRIWATQVLKNHIIQGYTIPSPK